MSERAIFWKYQREALRDLMRIQSAGWFSALAVLLVCRGALGLPAGAAGGPPHSASHPIPAVPRAAGAASRPVFYQPPSGPLGLAAVGDRWAVYSRGVNWINAGATRSAETWLATDMGVKVVDHAQKKITHFTRLDGLPDDRVLAVAAAADAAWAVVAVKHGEAYAAAVCELRRDANRWRVLRDTPRPIVTLLPQNTGANLFYVPGEPLENALIAACPEKVCVALSPVRRNDRVFASCFDRRLSVWDEIPALPAAISDRTTLSITWLDVDRDGVWLGTTAGLLRYKLREKVWRRFLPDRMVYAAVKAEDGTLWLATYIAAAQPLDQNPRTALDNTPAGHWIAAHFVPKTGIATYFPIPESGIRQPAYGVRTPVTFSGISLVGRTVWLTPGARHPYGNPVPFFRLDTHDGTWRSFPVQAPADVDPIPDAALAQPTLPRTTLQCAYYPWRLTEWVCRDATESPQDAAPRDFQVNRESDGSQWSTDGRTLVLTDKRGVTLRRFGLNQAAIPVTPQIGAVTVLNGLLYATSSGEVQAFDPGVGSWRRIRLPRSNSANTNDDRLIPDGEHLWIGTPSMALRYDPGTQLFAAESTTQTGGYRLLGTIGGVVWLRGPDNLLYRPDPQSGEPETAETAPLPAEVAGKYERGQPFGLAGGALWFRLQDKKEPDKGMVAGYDPIAGAWTRGHPVRSSYPNPPSCVGAGKRIYFPIAEDDASVQAYDTDTGQWSIAAPKAPQGRGLQTLALVSVDDDAIWTLDAGARSLMCYHRKTSNWELFDIPQGLWIPQNGNEAVRSGDAVYLATSLGVWSFHIGTHTWAQLPGFPGRDIYLNGITTDRGSVWSIARPGNGNRAFAVRLDKTSRRWSAWGEKEGFPERAYPNNILPDGSTAWTLASYVCFRLDAATNRWDNVSARLARPQSDQGDGPITVRPDLATTPYLEIADIVPDGDTVWLLPRRAVNQRDNSVQRPLLVQFDRRSGRYVPLTPTPGPSAMVVGNSMQVNTDAVWVPTIEGVYRFGKSDRVWRKIEPPAAAMIWGKTLTLRVVQHDGTNWFFGADSAIEWKD